LLPTYQALLSFYAALAESTQRLKISARSLGQAIATSIRGRGTTLRSRGADSHRR
jgi:hypothetical protein